MTTRPRTIDSLGLDASIQYAKNKALFEPEIIQESSFVAQQTKVSAATPYFSSESNPLFTIQRPISWAMFSEPSSLISDLVFSFQLIPSLGGYESTEEEIDPKDRIAQALAKKKKDTDPDTEEKQSKTLLVLLEYIATIDQSISLINAKRNQYQRG